MSTAHATERDLAGLEAWEIWFKDEDGKWQKVKSFGPHEKDRARASAAGLRDGLCDSDNPEPEVEIRARVAWAWEAESRQASKRKAAGHRKRRAMHYWSAAFHEHLLTLEGVPDKMPPGTFRDKYSDNDGHKLDTTVIVHEADGDEFGCMGHATTFTFDMEGAVPYGPDMASEIIAAIRRRVNELEEAYQQAGLCGK